ncbi:MAG: triose-phosphate isomerase [Clostridiales bacterium]|jgi:triosephosphate isomerase|nr:triose-phosphate isomerase [Clostridiales bacterium]
MNRKYRKTIIAGNWKMNLLPSEVKGYGEKLKCLAPKVKWCEIVICPPSLMLQAALKTFSNARIHVGAQNICTEAKGAYTGEISAAQVKDLGAKYVIVGHSERRQYYGETDKQVNLKVNIAIENGLIPIICLGETLEQREMGITLDHIRLQLKIALSGVPADKIRKVVIAYEPVWAIGTGKTATSEEAGEVCKEIRAQLRSLYGARIARSISILYGGSMNGDNAAELLAQPDIDGGLIGGASLDPEKFYSIILAANQ